MPGEETESKTLLDLVVTGGIGAALAAIFQAVRAARKHGGEEFCLRRFVAGLASAAAVGAIVAWTLDAFDINKELSAVIIAMCGYTGGRLLDIVESEIPETIQSAFDGLQKRLQEGKWRKDD
jgi:MFS family permease